MLERIEMLKATLEDELYEYFSEATTKEELRAKYRKVNTYILEHDEYNELSYFTRYEIIASALDNHIDRVMAGK